MRLAVFINGLRTFSWHFCVAACRIETFIEALIITVIETGIIAGSTIILTSSRSTRGLLAFGFCVVVSSDGPTATTRATHDFGLEIIVVVVAAAARIVVAPFAAVDQRVGGTVGSVLAGIIARASWVSARKARAAHIVGYKIEGVVEATAPLIIIVP